MNQRKDEAMKEPNGKDLLATLVNLLADQESVTIRFSIESVKGVQDAG